jgi:prepilin-type processing-associated H-X9-DG protein
VCASNVRQLALANTAYSVENNGRYCPGAARIRQGNRYRWHGTRQNTNSPFDPNRSPLAPYMGLDKRIRACPTFVEYERERGNGAFEAGTGGYGYNQAYVGRVVHRTDERSSFRVVTDLYGALAENVRRPAETLMFADTALAGVAQGVIEYSFAEPRFHPEYIRYAARPDPSLHFRHQNQANIAWCDGHVDRRRMTFTYRSGIYESDPAEFDVGWFGQEDDNGYFDLE